jgi:hypothetical protein
MIQKTNHLSKSVSLRVALRTFARRRSESVELYGARLRRYADTPARRYDLALCGTPL